jgi:hypothetical protein
MNRSLKPTSRDQPVVTPVDDSVIRIHKVEGTGLNIVGGDAMCFSLYRIVTKEHGLVARRYVTRISKMPSPPLPQVITIDIRVL